MSYDILNSLVSQGLSSYKIAKRLNCSQTTIRYWLKKFNLKTSLMSFKDGGKYQNSSGYHTSHIVEDDGSVCKICPKCKVKKEINKNNFYIDRSGKIHSWCKTCNNSITLEKQKQRKIKAVLSKGGKCQICGYSKYIGSLDFHHLDPSQKEYSIGQLRTYSLEKLKTELDKCICVCRNCHGEIHAGLIDLTKT